MARVEVEDTSPVVEKEIFKTLSAPVTIQWELTSYCNEKCFHCYNYWLRNSNENKLLVTEETKAIWDRAASEIIANKIFHVTLTGGEPLSVLKQAYPYLKRLSENGVEMSINTNLTMLTPDKIALLKELGIKSILTSLISEDAELNDNLAHRPNTYKDVSRGIKLAVSEGFWVGVNMVVTKDNFSDIYKTAEYVKSLGVESFSATKASIPTGSHDFEKHVLTPVEVKAMIGELVRIHNELGLITDSLEFYPMCLFDSQVGRDFAASHACSAGRTACTIGFDGQVRPCSHASQTYGSVLAEDGLNRSWRNLNPWRTTAYIPDKCMDCNFMLNCRGGCRSEAFVKSGSLKDPDPYCDYSQSVLLNTSAGEPDVDLRDIFIFRKGIKTRREDFGGLLYLGSSKWVPVNRELLSFYKENSNNMFRCADMAIALGLNRPDDIMPTIKLLAQKLLIKKGGEENEGN